MADQHGVGDPERIEERQDESRVVGVGVPVGRFVREPEGAIVEGDRAESRGRHGRKGVAPGVERCAEAMNEDDGRTGPGLDVTDARAVDRHVLRGEIGAGGVAGLRRDRGGPACRNQQDQQCGQAPHAGTWGAGGLRRARRASSTTFGWELHRAASSSPAPVAVIT